MFFFVFFSVYYDNADPHNAGQILGGVLKVTPLVALLLMFASPPAEPNHRGHLPDGRFLYPPARSHHLSRTR